MKKEDHKLKKFMKDNFDFDNLKKAGFYKGIKKSDYHAQSERVRIFFDFDSIYEYNSTVSYAHITYSKAERKDHAFIEKFGTKAEINLMNIHNDN